MNTDSVSTPLSGAERKILLSVPLAILATAISIFGIFYYQVTMGVSHTVLERSGAIFSYLTDRIPPQSLLELNSPADESSPLYAEVQNLLTSVRQLTAVRYLYTARLNDQARPSMWWTAWIRPPRTSAISGISSNPRCCLC